MNQVFGKIYEDYKRSNKVNKEKMIKKYAFSNEVDFLKFLGFDPVLSPREEETPTDVVIAFDTTGSMRSYIGSVRKHVKETIGNLFTNTPNLRLKIVAFGDYCDMITSTEFGKAYQESPLTDDKDVLIKFVAEAIDTGGGDSEEFYELVIRKITQETPWRNGSNRSILLIADDNPHLPGYSCHPFVRKAQIDWKVEAKAAAAIGIRIDTLRIHSYIGWYEELSKITNGTCMNFKSAEKTQNIVEASAYLNSRSERGISATRVLYRSAVEDGDMELAGAYKGMASTRGINLDE